MGMYTELIFGATLKEKTPTYITDALNYVVNDIENKDVNLSDEAKHFIDEYELKTLIWRTSYYFGAHTNTPTCVKTNKCWCISFRANCKNYQDIVEKFIEFIRPYVKYGSGLTNIFAIVQHEKDEYPTLYGTKDKYEYLDKERITADRKYANELTKIINGLYNFGSPDLLFYDDKLKEYNIDKDNWNNIDIYRVMVDIIKKRLKDNGVTEDLKRLADENQNLREKLMFAEFYRDKYQEELNDLKMKLECK